MRPSRATALVLSVVAVVVSAMPGTPAPALAQEYTLESRATYEVRPEERVIGVSIELAFTNTTPDPPGQFSVFSELKLAVHDAATDVAATDDDGALEVAVAVEDQVNVATVQLRDEIRFEDEVSLTVTYTLPDGESPQLRVRPSLVVFPAWSFGTAGQVTVSVPTGYELRVDGDPMTVEGGRLTSGPIANPGEWLALVTAVRPADYTSFEATVPLNGGTADLLVRAFSDDEAWGERTLAMVTEALPLMEQELGIPYPRLGQLILTEAVTADSSGFGEGAPGGNEILVAFDQPPFTALHQVAHVWLSPALVEARWIREGLASRVAAGVAQQIEVQQPYDPAADAQARAATAFPLDSWSPSADVAAEAYGYAASWAFINELEASVGLDALRTVIARVAGSVGAYETGDVEPEPNDEPPVEPLTTRSFLDHLETVSGADLGPLFRERVLTEADIALLEPRAEARGVLDELVQAAGSWGAPDPIRGAMRAWDFETALAQIATAREWLGARDDLLAEMRRVGLSAPDRLQQAYRAYGGGPEAVSELEAERAVVQDYAVTAEAVSAERSFLQRIGLIGGQDPQAQLNLANGRFADGDLREAVDALAEARRIVDSAQTGGIVRLASLGILVLILVTAAVVLFRRRASYTPAK